MAEQELDLIQFAACEMTETGARASQVVGRQLVDAGASRNGIVDANALIEAWCTDYNAVSPHSALGGRTPTSLPGTV